MKAFIVVAFVLLASLASAAPSSTPAICGLCTTVVAEVEKLAEQYGVPEVEKLVSRSLRP
jgi:hypothetical protein